MVSIIMPTYNRAYIIERAIQSVLSQTCEDWELIIVDDGSTDNTKDIVEKYVGKKIKYYVNEKNKGANASRNVGASYAKGEYLTFLDSDNYWPDYKLDEQVSKWKACNLKRCFLYGQVQITDGDDVRVVPESCMEPNQLKQHELHENCIDTNTIFIEKALFHEVGGFDKSLPRLQDWELVLRLLYEYNVEPVCCDRLLSYNEIQSNSIGRDSLKFVKAYIRLLRKYFCKYLNEQEMVVSLYRLVKEYPIYLNEITEQVKEIGKDNSALLIELISWIIRYEEIYGVEIMMNPKVNVVEIMDKIKKEIQEDGSTVNSLCSMSPYYKKMMNEYRKQEQIVILGAGNLGVILYEIMKNEGIGETVKCFCDNNVSRQNTEYMNLTILSPAEAYERFPEAMYVVTPKGYENELVRQLVDMGVSIHKISIVDITSLGV